MRGPAYRRISGAGENDRMGRSKVVLRILRDQGSAVEQCRGGYPGVGGLDAAAIRSGGHYLGPLKDQVAVSSLNRMGRPPHVIKLKLPGMVDTQSAPAQIGRASCRE